jgi:hypothetical protein
LRRIVRGAALAAGCAVVAIGTAGCGAGRPAGDSSTARLTAAVLSTQDLPSDYLPAEDQQVFRGVGAADPNCRRLLDLADLRGLRDVPDTHTFFYRIDPGSTLAEHVVTLGPERVQAYLRQARKAADGCKTITVSGDQDDVRLHRHHLPALPRQAFGVHYGGAADDQHSINFDMVMAPVDAGRLMIVAQPSVVNEVHGHKALRIERIAATALHKLQATEPGH